MFFSLFSAGQRAMLKGGGIGFGLASLYVAFKNKEKIKFWAQR